MIGTAAGGGGTHNLFMTTASGTGSVEALVVSNDAKGAPSWSPDGKALAFEEFNGATKIDIMVMAMDTHSTTPYIHGSANETQPTSPNGKWVAYASDESGRFEVYVQPYPATGDKWTISTTGGAQPRWRRDGKELFYLSIAQQLTAVDVSTGGERFEAGVPHVLFSTRASVVSGISSTFRQFGVTANGQAFLINETTSTATAARDPLRVVTNWTSLLRR